MGADNDPQHEECPGLQRIMCAAEFRHLSNAMGEMKGDVKSIRKVLIGNGEAGLVTRVMLLEDGHTRRERLIHMLQGIVVALVNVGLLWFIAQGVRTFLEE